MNDLLPSTPPEPAKSLMSSGLFMFGAIVSVVWLVAGILVMVLLANKPTQANEWGDVFAGLSAPLAFLWLVLGFLQQGDELRLSTDALRLQAVELKNSVEQQKELVIAAKKQIEVGLDERRAARTAAQPKFAFRFDDWTGDGQNTLFNLWVVNEGAPCTGVRFTYTPPATEYYKALDYRPRFERGETTRCTLCYGKLFPIAGAIVEITFTDELGHVGMEVHKVTPVGTTHLNFAVLARSGHTLSTEIG